MWLGNIGGGDRTNLVQRSRHHLATYPYPSHLYDSFETPDANMFGLIFGTSTLRQPRRDARRRQRLEARKRRSRILQSTVLIFSGLVLTVSLWSLRRIQGTDGAITIVPGWKFATRVKEMSTITENAVVAAGQNTTVGISAPGKADQIADSNSTRIEGIGPKVSESVPNGTANPALSRSSGARSSVVDEKITTPTAVQADKKANPVEAKSPSQTEIRTELPSGSQTKRDITGQSPNTSTLSGPDATSAQAGRPNAIENTAADIAVRHNTSANTDYGHGQTQPIAAMRATERTEQTGGEWREAKAGEGEVQKSDPEKGEEDKENEDDEENGDEPIDSLDVEEGGFGPVITLADTETGVSISKTSRPRNNETHKQRHNEIDKQSGRDAKNPERKRMESSREAQRANIQQNDIANAALPPELQRHSNDARVDRVRLQAGQKPSQRVAADKEHATADVSISKPTANQLTRDVGGNGSEPLKT